MKNLLKSYGLIITVTAIAAGAVGFYIGCKNNSKEDIRGENPKEERRDNVTPISTLTNTTCNENAQEITQQCANAYVYNYGDWAGRVAKRTNIILSNSNSPIPADSVISYWTIDISEIDSFRIKYKNVKKICAYLGFTKPRSFNSNIDSNSFKLQIGHGLNQLHLILAPGYPVNSLPLQPAPGTFYDLIKPCPSACDIQGFLTPSYTTGYNNGYN